MASRAALRGDLQDALERVGFPVFVLDTTGRVVWQNDATAKLVGERVGRHFGEPIVAEDRRRAREQIMRRAYGDTTPAEFQVKGRTAAGELVIADVSAVPLREGGHVVGVFGVVHAHPVPETAAEAHVHLTPRQSEVLREIARGCATGEIARRLGISEETVRNHIRGIFRALGVHSRLDAVLRAHELGLITLD